jgi:hypothetical protein
MKLIYTPPTNKLQSYNLAILQVNESQNMAMPLNIGVKTGAN